MNRLDIVREKIDSTDREIAKLFVRRLELMPEVISAKKELGLEIFQPDREEAVLNKISSFCPARGDELKRLYKEIMDICKEEQRKYI